ncbi:MULTISPECIES: DUF969 domain-containing protein [Sorangium]|uniref:Membrane protein n=1 Tax=Sorangium cellulosum (strain So ce56) TaxID=448385 RepID=A9GJV9_SORC5|nr:DUF969 domain-containing protein [Sorangium cellulosum]CAN96495.1 putative membrane protein [Sorangium cellulosum So ce56]
MLTFLGVAVVVVGFIARIHPLLVVAAAAIVTSLSAGMGLVAGISVLGKAFNDNRYVSLVWLVLPVIGLLERSGLQERARALISRVKTATTGRILLVYFAVRQLSAALGLTSLGGHAQMVRPLIAPMAEAVAENRYGPLPDRTRWLIRASAAAADNVALFFGEDIFLAIASILLIKAFLEQNGIFVEPLQLSVWAIPTAVLALLIHGTRLLLLDRRLHRELARAGAGKAAE